MLQDKGQGIDVKTFDLSEKHLIWFGTNPISEAIDPDQVGEGMFITGKEENSYTSSLYDNGGYGLNTTTLFASGVGPVREDAATLVKIDDPETRAQMELYLRCRGSSGLTEKEYLIANPDEGMIIARETLVGFAGMEPEAVVQNKDKSGTVRFLREGGYLSDDDFNNLDVDKLLNATLNYCLAERTRDNSYTKKDDWTIPETVTIDGQTIPTRNLTSGYTMLDGNKLPDLFNKDADGKWESVNWDGINAVKSELMKGHGVCAGFQADASMPGEPPRDRNMRPDTWAHYTCKDEGTGHMICIVGWDDDYSVSNFKKDHQPPANGAWLVKNSWGCETEYEESATGKHIGESKWGVENEEGKTTGYFWISYYDKSLSYCESMTFDTDLAEAEGELSVKMYDYMPSLIGVRTGQVTEEQSSNLLKTANVFVNDTETDVSLVSVSTKTASPNATVKYSVYLLTDNAANPEDGVLLGTKTATYEYAGFHREKLDGSITVKNGEKYAVVAEETVVENGNKLYEYAVNASYSKEHAEAVQAAEAESGISSDDRDRNADEYGVAVVNKGESFVYDNGAWTDWAESEPLVY